MTATPHSIALPAVLGLLVCACSEARPAAEPGARQAIEAAVNRYVAASNEGDADALAQLYTEDAVLLPPDHAPVLGREAIQDFWRQGTDSGLQVRTIRVEVDGGVGYLIGMYTLPRTNQEPADSGKYVMCLRRQRDGSWKLAADIWNSSAVEAPTAEPPAPVPPVS